MSRASNSRKVELTNVIDGWVIPMFIVPGFDGEDQQSLTFTKSSESDSRKVALEEGRDASRQPNGSGVIIVKSGDDWFWNAECQPLAQNSNMAWLYDFLATQFDDVWVCEEWVDSKPKMLHVTASRTTINWTIDGALIQSPYSISVDMGERLATDSGCQRFPTLYGPFDEPDEAKAWLSAITDELEGSMLTKVGPNFWAMMPPTLKSGDRWGDDLVGRFARAFDKVRLFNDHGEWVIAVPEAIIEDEAPDDSLMKPTDLERLLREPYKKLIEIWKRLDQSELDPNWAAVLTYKSSLELMEKIAERADRIPGRNRKAIVEFIDEIMMETFPNEYEDEEEEDD